MALTLFDVDVRDENGRPVPGLMAADFSVSIDGSKPKRVYSADDLCEVSSPRLTTPHDYRAEMDRKEQVKALAPIHYVLYFDFSQLQQAGRYVAVETATEWLKANERTAFVQAFGYSSTAGVRQLSSLTQDRDEILRGIADAASAPELFDPFPSLREFRVQECVRAVESGSPSARATCLDNARKEYRHGRQSLTALRWHLRGLSHVPGQKVVLYLHQNADVYPGRRYGADDFEAGDHLTLMDEIGYEATSAQAVIFPAFVGNAMDDDAGTAINFGANVADFTGGGFNRGEADLGRLMTAVDDFGRCRYRLGIVGDVRDEVAKLIVYVRGTPLPFRYRIKFLGESERWLREAQTVLSNPGSVSDVTIDAGLVPIDMNRGRWDVAAQVAIWPESLTFLQQGKKFAADWEVGALVYREEGGSKWELISVSELKTPSRTPGTPIVHERLLSRIKPGKYKITAYARDRIANVFGGAEATLTVPDKGTAIIGPIVRGAVQDYVGTEFQLLSEPNRPPQAGVRYVNHIPAAADEPVRQGQTLQFVTLVCRAKSGAPLPTVVRSVSQAGSDPLLRFEDIVATDDRPCVEVLDPIDTSSLGPGDYSYDLRWRTTSSTGDETIVFNVVGADQKESSSSVER